MRPDLRTILKLRVPVIVQIGQRRMTLDDVLALGPGAIVELNKNAEDQLDLLVNNKPVGVGTAVKVGENFGVSLTHIGSARERIAALAGAAEAASDDADHEAEVAESAPSDAPAPPDARQPDDAPAAN